MARKTATAPATEETAEKAKRLRIPIAVDALEVDEAPEEVSIREREWEPYVPLVQSSYEQGKALRISVPRVYDDEDNEFDPMDVATKMLRLLVAAADSLKLGLNKNIREYDDGTLFIVFQARERRVVTRKPKAETEA